MIRTTAIVAAALVATLAQADAGQRTQRPSYVGGFYSAPVQLYPGYAGYAAQGNDYGSYDDSYYGGYYGPRAFPGSIWSYPKCFTDEGYGRYGSCEPRGGQ